MQDAENNWAFDIFGFAEATPGYTLSLLYCYLAQRVDAQVELVADSAKFAAYARKVEQGYDASNPYHNR